MEIVCTRALPHNDHADNRLQLRILHRAMDILKPGGRMVYSTCSFNPVENEAVVAAALNSRKGQYMIRKRRVKADNTGFRIVDASASIPHLKIRPGLSEWKVAGQPQGNKHGDDITFFESFEAAEKVRAEGGNDKASWKETAPTFWPPANARYLDLDKWYVTSSIFKLKVQYASCSSRPKHWWLLCLRFGEAEPCFHRRHDRGDG